MRCTDPCKTGMAITSATIRKPWPTPHLTTVCQPFIWGTFPFPVESQTCPRTPLSSFLDGPRYVSSWKAIKSPKELLMRCCVTDFCVYQFLSRGTLANLQRLNGQLECAPFSLTGNFLEQMMASLLPLRKAVAPWDTAYEGHFLFLLKKSWSRQRGGSLGELVFSFVHVCFCTPATPHLHTALPLGGIHPGGISMILSSSLAILLPGHPPSFYSLKIFT